jgi:YjbE family integral membrane protein
MLGMLGSTHFWVDVFKIIVIDVLLSGDNAVVIALACRNLPPKQRKKGIMLGVVGAIVLRIALTFFTVSLLRLPYLKVFGAILLLWIGVKLLLQEEEFDVNKIKANMHLWGAVKTIIFADFVMSLDNVLGVVAAAHGNIMLLVFGLLVSIPLIAWSGYVAGEMLESDAKVAFVLEEMPYITYWLLPAFCAVLVIVLGMWLATRKVAVVADLVEEQVSTTSNGKQ